MADVLSFLQSLYMAVITLAGVGYGEIIDTSHNPALRVFNMFVVGVGVMIAVYVFSVVTALCRPYGTSREILVGMLTATDVAGCELASLLGLGAVCVPVSRAP